jgi:Tfp pilus assembly protein PilW
MRPFPHSTRSPDHGFALIELPVGLLISATVVAALMGFYVSEQRGVRHNQIEIETSQTLRLALEQMSRDLRSAERNLLGTASPTFLTWTQTDVEFQLDANDDGVIAPDGTGVNVTGPAEHKGFQLPAGSTTLNQYDASVTSNNWVAFADNVQALSFTYLQCDGVTAATAANNIARIGISITVSRPSVGGVSVTRTEVESVRLRNRPCP